MPSLEIDILKRLQDDYTKYTTFIESGTYYGDTIFNMESYFDKLVTIDIKKEFYDICRNKNKGNKIDFHLGDSSDVFKKILPKIKTKSILFLDGHWSAENTGRGNKDCPLYEELNEINNLLQTEAILIIDDYRLFGKGPNKKNENCNWEDINKETILKILEKRINKCYHLPSEITEDDRFIIHINALNLENIITFSKLGIHGRLGNQMFQYAALKSLAAKLNCEALIPNNTQLRIHHGQSSLLKCFKITSKSSERIGKIEFAEGNYGGYYDSNFWNCGTNTNLFGHYESELYFEHMIVAFVLYSMYRIYLQIYK